MAKLSRIKEKILDKAIELFAANGAHGVAFEELAKICGVTRGSIYRLFRTTENLFSQALKTALSRSLDPANFLMMIFPETKGQDFSVAVAAAARRWYFSMSQSTARLLMQAEFVHYEWEESVNPVEKIIKILAAIMEKELAKNKASRLDTTAAARCLVLGLFQLKLSFRSSRPAKEEQQAVEGMLRVWLRAISFAA